MKRESDGAAGAIQSNKAASRRTKKGAAGAAGESDQRRERKPRSASASAAAVNTGGLVAPDTTGYVLPLGGVVHSGGDGCSGGGVCERPPRSPVKQVKACVPTLEDALDDVQVRFVLNLPEAELSSADRLFFQLEQAWWFYEDFIADAHKHLPHFRLKEFAKLLFQHCEALRPLNAKYNELFEHFRSWKGTIPTAGCILLNTAMTKLVLVKCWKGNSRGLPKGKINQGEPALAAAVREVLEETGYDASEGANEKDFLSLYLHGQQTTMYIVSGVDEDFAFEPQVRKEISAIEWFPLDALPKGSFGVEPFIPRLRRWMAKTKGMRAPKDATAEARTQSMIRFRKGRATSPDVSSAAAAAVSQSQPTSPTAASSLNGASSSKKQGRKGSKGGGGSKELATGAADAAGTGGYAPTKGENAARACSAPNRRGHAKGYDVHNRDTFGGGQDQANGGDGGDGGWNFEAMLAANERLTGRTFVYDGNPHEFGDPAQAARAATETAAAYVAGGPAIASREEDQVGHLKQRGGGGNKGGSSKGKGHAKANAAAHGKAPLEANGTPVESRVGGGGGGGGGGAVEAAVTDGRGGLRMDVVGTAESRRGPQPTNGQCTEGGAVDRGGGGVAGSAAELWGSGAVGSSSSAAAAAESEGLFGEFKFDMMDIMNAVPQGYGRDE